MYDIWYVDFRRYIPPSKYVWYIKYRADISLCVSVSYKKPPHTHLPSAVRYILSSLEIKSILCNYPWLSLYILLWVSLSGDNDQPLFSSGEILHENRGTHAPFTTSHDDPVQAEYDGVLLTASHGGATVEGNTWPAGSYNNNKHL